MNNSDMNNTIKADGMENTCGAQSTETWYAVRIVPGSQRMAKALRDAPADRVGETLLERECREHGIAVFMPSFWTVVRHQRTNKLIEKRFPLLVGYAFVKIEDRSFGVVREMRTVSYFLRGGGRHGLASFTDATMVELYLADLEAKEQHATMKKSGEADVRQVRRSILGHQLGLIFPKGRRKKMPIRIMAAAAMNGLTPKSKARCAEILKELEDLDRQEAESCKPKANHLSSAA